MPNTNNEGPRRVTHLDPLAENTPLLCSASHPAAAADSVSTERYAPLQGIDDVLRAKKRLGSECRPVALCSVPVGFSHVCSRRPIDPDRSPNIVRLLCSNRYCRVSQWVHKSCFVDWEHHTATLARVKYPFVGCTNIDTMWSDMEYEYIRDYCSCVCGSGYRRKDLNFRPKTGASPAWPIDENSLESKMIGADWTSKLMAGARGATSGIMSEVPNSMTEPNIVANQRVRNPSQEIRNPPSRRPSDNVVGPNIGKSVSPQTTVTGQQIINLMSRQPSQYQAQMISGLTERNLQQRVANPPPVGYQATSGISHTPWQISSAPMGMGQLGSSGWMNALQHLAPSAPKSQTAAVPSLRQPFTMAATSSGASAISVAGPAMLMKQKQVASCAKQPAARRKYSSASVEEPPQTSRGSIFHTRSDFTAFRSLPAVEVNTYRIQLKDEGQFGSDRTRLCIMAALSRAGVTTVDCVVCGTDLPIYDTFPLVDGTLFLSPLRHGKAGVAVEMPKAAKEKLYLNAVCISCLRNDQQVMCRQCSVPWRGSIFTIGCVYMYDIFAALPCCRERSSCSSCHKPLFDAAGSGPKAFSDYSRRLACPACGAKDHHLVKSLDAAFIRLPLPGGAQLECESAKKQA